MARGFSCLIVGQGSLPVQCGELLSSRGHEIRGAACLNDFFHAWAQARCLRCTGPDGDLRAFVAAEPFDVLFSIVNPRVLPPEVLAAPRRLAVNYHDALLPRYAGVHATSWALLARESVHGVTWHAMTGQVDGGDILRQREVPVAPDETALTLNLKCHEAALAAFAELLEDLEEGRLARTPQDLSRRTFFSRRRLVTLRKRDEGTTLGDVGIIRAPAAAGA